MSPAAIADMHNRLLALHEDLVVVKREMFAAIHQATPEQKFSIVSAEAFADVAESTLWRSVCVLAAEIKFARPPKTEGGAS